MKIDSKNFKLIFALSLLIIGLSIYVISAVSIDYGYSTGYTHGKQAGYFRGYDDGYLAKAHDLPPGAVYEPFNLTCASRYNFNESEIALNCKGD